MPAANSAPEETLPMMVKVRFDAAPDEVAAVGVDFAVRRLAADSIG
jgi:hypothetical protein